MTNTTDEPLHVDDWLDTPNFHHCIGEDYAKFVLDYHRWPAWKQQAYRQWMGQYKLFCTYEGKRYRCQGQQCNVSYADRKGKYQGQTGVTLPLA